MQRADAKGFTLIELVIIIMLLSTLAAVALQRYSTIVGNAADVSAKGLLAALRTANEFVYLKRR